MPTKRCVKCDSENVRTGDDVREGMVMPIVPEPGPDDIYFHCVDCGHEWTEGKDEEEAE